MDEYPEDKARQVTFIERESLKPPLGDFTLDEYTEKVILYGFLMVGLYDHFSKDSKAVINKKTWLL